MNVPFTARGASLKILASTLAHFSRAASAVYGTCRLRHEAAQRHFLSYAAVCASVYGSVSDLVFSAKCPFPPRHAASAAGDIASAAAVICRRARIRRGHAVVPTWYHSTLSCPQYPRGTTRGTTARPWPPSRRTRSAKPSSSASRRARPTPSTARTSPTGSRSRPRPASRRTWNR